MDASTRRLLAIGALVAPALHTLTDVHELLHAGFTPIQLWLNYLAFLPVPAIMLGLYAIQMPRISSLGLVGALLYGFAFVYFAHTTLVAIATQAVDYEQLWSQLGASYTVHGGVMVVGGIAFGWATGRAGVLPRWTAWVFLLGVVLNCLLVFLPLPDVSQTVGTALRNGGLMGMGWASRTLHKIE